MIDQDQARKFWANWVRREIGGSDMVQDAAVSAALNEILQGRDNRAAADAARRTAQSLGVGVPTMTATPSSPKPAPTPTRDVPFPGPTGNAPFPAPAAAALPSGMGGQPLGCKLCG